MNKKKSETDQNFLSGLRDYHSNFDPECKGERGFINQLYTELGYDGPKYSCSFLHFPGHLEVVYNISLVQVGMLNHLTVERQEP